MGTRGSSTVLFDLRSERGIVDLLAVIRKSPLGINDKRFLRDLVLAYTQSKGDKGIYDELIELIQQYNLSPELLYSPALEQNNTAPIIASDSVPATASMQSMRPRSGFSSGRTVPTFTAHVAKIAHKTDVPTAPLVPSSVTDASFTASATVPVITSPDAVVKKEISRPVLATPPIQPVSAKASDEGGDYLTRIQEIKSDINQKIGNPVNLVDIDNHVGREYMAALLDAMKVISNGGRPEAEMIRLESAYQAAIRLIGSDSNNVDGVAPDEPSPLSVSSQVIKPIIPQMPSIPADENQPASSVLPIPVVEKIVPVSPTPDPYTHTVDASEHASTLAPAANLEVHSVAEAKPLRNITELPLANEVQTAPAGTDPLFTKEIDDGLDQLLSEWPLFSKSGLFGRGPNRRQHPLFIQLANMPIPLILSGRFEGATPQVMQSISDYMNGWRYEQGLIYDNEESFEHFLRRVIRHIINWQRKKKQA